MPGLHAGSLIRSAAVAGMFYPADPVDVQAEVDRLLDQDAPEPQSWSAALVPHAGWIYSGRITAAVLKRIVIPPTVVILCPKHRSGGADWAIAPYDGWAIPGATIPADTELAQTLADRIDDWQLDATPHQQEHAIEVQLPLLSRLTPDSRLVGITCGRGDWESCLRYAKSLAEVLREREEPALLVISSDMNHFAPDAVNRRLDALAIEALESLDPQKLYETCRRLGVTMCGLLPAVVVMQTLRILGRLSRCEKVAYATSADAGGDSHRVVGYAGMLLG